MHEVSVARQIISIASARAQALGYPRMKSVRISIGSWTCVNPDLLRRAFAAATSQGDKPGPELQIHIVQPDCRCEECGAVFEPDDFALRCPTCDSPRVVLTQGREMVVESIEV